ncbi:hypothetical protein CFREI_07530 [Corynebacterium freiburgense]|nr:hypothetical protein CFREI_07530 [Corynebacterium freiburgense]
MSTTPRKDPEKRRGSRYRARARAVDILFEAEFRDVDPVAIVEDRIELSQQPEFDIPPVTPYTQQIVGGVAVELDRVDDTIARYLAKNWELERIPAVDRAILRIAVWELLFNPEVPTKTAVVEGVELGSQYSTDFAAPYINAVLDAVAKNIDELRAEAQAEIAAADSPETVEENTPDDGEFELTGGELEAEFAEAESLDDIAADDGAAAEKVSDFSSENFEDTGIGPNAEEQPQQLEVPQPVETSQPVEISAQDENSEQSMPKAEVSESSIPNSSEAVEPSDVQPQEKEADSSVVSDVANAEEKSPS